MLAVKDWKMPHQTVSVPIGFCPAELVILIFILYRMKFEQRKVKKLFQDYVAISIWLGNRIKIYQIRSCSVIWIREDKKGEKEAFIKKKEYYQEIQEGLIVLLLQGSLVIQANQYLPQNLSYQGSLGIQADQVHPKTCIKIKLKYLHYLNYITKYYL